MEDNKARRLDAELAIGNLMCNSVSIYYLLMKWLTPEVYLFCAAALLLAADIVMLSRLRTRGARIFETL